MINTNDIYNSNDNPNLINNNLSAVPVISYSNAYLYKRDVLRDNKGKTGVYRWTHIESGKSYIGSAIDLSRRLKNYYNITYLEKGIKKIILSFAFFIIIRCLKK